MFAKLEKLKQRLKEMQSVVIAYSGGVDSSFLIKVARDTLGEKAVAVTAVSETYSTAELRSALAVAKEVGIRHKIIRTREIKNPRFRANPRERCYYCKRELFLALGRLARKLKARFVIDGSNTDDLKDWRPGARAKREYGVVSVLQEAGLSKAEIRRLSRCLGLKTWDRPALACLASRIPYHSRITKKRLKRIETAELLLRERLKIKGNLRVRDFGDLASIEVDKPEISTLSAQNELEVLLRPLGFQSIRVDLQGYRMGSLNNDKF